MSTLILEGVMKKKTVKSLLKQNSEIFTADAGITDKAAFIIKKYTSKVFDKYYHANKEKIKKFATKKTQPDEDDVDESVYISTYKKLLFEAITENKKLTSLIQEADDSVKESGSAEVVKMKVNGNEIRFIGPDGPIKDPKILKRLNEELSGTKNGKPVFSLLKPGVPFKTESQSVKQGENARYKGKLAIIQKLVQKAQTVEIGINEDSPALKGFDIDWAGVKTTVKEVLVDVLKSGSFKKMAKELVSNIEKLPKEKEIDDSEIPSAFTNIVACFVVGQAVSSINGAAKLNKDKEENSKAQKQEFINAAKEFQNSLPAEEIAKVCDLPGMTDIKISPATILYDVNGKQIGAKWGLDEEIDSDSEIKEWAEFLKANNGDDAPAHPEAIAAAIAQEADGLAKVAGVNLGEISAVAATGLAATIATGGLALPATIAALTGEGVAGILKKGHVRKGAQLLEIWYNKAMELAKKYEAYSLNKVAKKAEQKK